MKKFKDVLVGEHFVLHNGQQLIRVQSETSQSHNCIDYRYLDKRFFIEDETECLTVDELMESSEDCSGYDVVVVVDQEAWERADAYAKRLK